MCEHQFCRDCWREYLTIKIMDEGVGQVAAVDVNVAVVLCDLFTYMCVCVFVFRHNHKLCKNG